MADEPNPAPAPKADPLATMQALIDSDQTRKLVVKLVFGQFVLSIAAIGAAMVLKGWEISNTTNSILVMILTAEIAAMQTAVGFYLGSSQGSAMKSMLAALTSKQ